MNAIGRDLSWVYGSLWNRIGQTSTECGGRPADTGELRSHGSGAGPGPWSAPRRGGVGDGCPPGRAPRPPGRAPRPPGRQAGLREDFLPPKGRLPPPSRSRRPRRGHAPAGCGRRRRGRPAARAKGSRTALRGGDAPGAVPRYGRPLYREPFRRPSPEEGPRHPPSRAPLGNQSICPQGPRSVIILNAGEHGNAGEGSKTWG